MKKVRANRQFEDIFELADYLNYYFSKNPDAQVSMNDLKKIVDNNPQFSLEEATITNSAFRPIISDSDGHTMMLEMQPKFSIYEDEVEEGEDEESDEESEEDNNNSEEEEEEEEALSTEEIFDWVKPGEEFVWVDPNDDNPETAEHNAKVLEVKSEDGKVHTDTTEIRAEVEDVGTISIFCDEIKMQDADDEEIEDAEVVEDEDEESEESEEEEEEDE